MSFFTDMLVEKQGGPSGQIKLTPLMPPATTMHNIYDFSRASSSGRLLDTPPGPGPGLIGQDPWPLARDPKTWRYEMRWS